MKYYTTVVLLLASSFLFSLISQNTIKGQIIDAQSGSPIPYVNIGIKRLASGTVSDEQGVYQLSIGKISPEDKIFISAIGYESKEMTSTALIKNPTISLQPRVYTIEDIELSAKKWNTKEIVIGNTTSKRKQSVGFGNSQLGTEIGALLPLDKETWIKSAHFVVNRGNKDSLLFRLNIFDYSDGQLGENLVRENILVAAPTKKGLMSIDLEKYNLVTDQPILISLQWIKAYEGGGELLITFNARTSSARDNMFLKPFSVSNFKMVSQSFPGAPKYEICFYIKGQQVKK